VSTQVTALLVVHNESANALRALAAIQSQTVKPHRILVVDSSKQKLDLPLESISVNPKTKLGAIVRAGLNGLEPSSNHWLWLVHDDSEPKSSALEQLLSAIENSDTVAQVGPLQLNASRPREISQLGLTLSRFGEVINPNKGQLDQSQHDQVKDVLAVSTSGMLVRTDAYEEVGGLNDRVATLAADLDLSIRLRRHGYRVVVAPRAKVLHSALTLSGSRGQSWLGGSVKTARRKATIQLRLTHDSLPLALLYWLALPITTIFRTFWRLAQKRPSFIWSELRAGAWGFFTLPKRLGARSHAGRVPTRSLNSLRASWSDVSKHNRQALEAEESAQSLAAFERGDHEAVDSNRSKNFTRSGGWIFMLFLLIVSWKQLPFGEAFSGGSAIPLSSDWFTIFARAGASWQPIGQGFIGPSDPFNWVLLALSSATFWAPNLSLVFLLWIARAIAFASAWRMFSLLTGKAWQRNLGALCFALMPALGASINSGDFPAIIVSVLIPWLVYAVARSAGLGRSGSARSDARTWSWVGLSGVLLAAIGASSPAVGVLALVGLGLVAFTKIRRLGYLFWIPLPLAAIYFPLAMYEVIGLAHPLALLAEPTIGVASHNSAIESLAIIGNWENWGLAILVLLAVASLLVRRWIVSLSIAIFGLLAFGFSSFIQSLRFPANTTSSGYAVAAVIALAVIALVVHLLASLSARPILALLATALILLSAPLVWSALGTTSATQTTDGSVVPLLLQKQAEQGTDLQFLIVNQNTDSYDVQWLPLSGLHLEDANLAYRFSNSINRKPETYQLLAQEVGNLVSGNGAASASGLTKNKIGYILVPQSIQNSSLVASLESSELLESAGLTPFGELWRVIGISPTDAPETHHSPWSVTKVIQLATLLGFVLLAIPSRGKTKRPSDSVIFIDQSESELDV
jgi:GT2 family glycosyltransferase